MTVHVITATKHGSTAEIGAAIAARLRDRGHDAVAEGADSIAAVPAAGDAIVLGSPIYMGKWMKSARSLLDRLATEPPGRELFVFTVGPLGSPPEPDDAKPERAVERLVAERATSSRIFAGKLALSELNPLERLAIRAVKAADGDYRDWPAIEAWADQISDELVAARARSVAAGNYGHA